MDDKKIQWHLGFTSAMELELKENRKSLDFQKTYKLNTGALEIDLLIIKKEPSIHITNEIGCFFRGHNILEYKSPEAHLDIDTFSKTLAYAQLYKAYGKKLNEIQFGDMTVSLIRETKPEGLFQHLRGCGFAVLNPYKGTYYLKGPLLFPVQVIVTGELDKKSHTWLTALSRKLQKEDMQGLLDKVSQMTEKSDIEMANSVLEVSVNANRQVIEALMGDESMFETLMEIMEPKIMENEGMFKTLMEIMEPKINEIRKVDREEARKEGLQEGRKEGLQEGRQEERKKSIQTTISILKTFNHKDAEIKLQIMEKYGITEDEADEYLQS